MDALNKFWLIVVEVWENGFLGVNIGRTIIAVFIFLAFLLIRRLFVRLVINRLSAMTHRRIYWMIGVEFRTTIEQLRQIRDHIENYILESTVFAHPPEVPTFVRIDRFNDSSIDIMVYCFTKTIVWAEWLEIKLAYKIKEIVETAGTSFAFPSRSIYVETVPGDQAEVFIPPSPAKTK